LQPYHRGATIVVMSTSIEWQAVTKTAEETEALAEKIGRRLQGGEVIELISDLGGGKTTFVRGLVRGLGSSAKVSSPTFTISKLYKAPKHEVFHFDFYRLPEAGLMAAELADVVQHVLPASRLTVRIEQTPEGQRRLHFSCPESLEYALEGLRQ
jgi:tRNA threonylcarbamoyl adenosine modification protein YjeE